MFRLHIDIPLDMTEDWAAQLSKTITAHLMEYFQRLLINKENYNWDWILQVAKDSH